MIEIRSATHHYKRIIVAAGLFITLVCIVAWHTASAFAAGNRINDGERVVTVHDSGEQIGLVTNATTLRGALEQAGISINQNDITEPSLDEPLVASSYEANIYRSRPVVVKDGAKSVRVVTAYRTAKQITNQAGITLNDADIAELKPVTDFAAEGVAEILAIDRATPINFVFYGKTVQTSTRAVTVGELLKERKISASKDDVVKPELSAPIQAGMTVELWRNGKQVVTADEEIAFGTRQVKDADHDSGYHEIQTKGENGKRTVTYEIEMRNGAEVGRKETNSIITKQAVEQVEIVGAKVVAGAGLTKSKGVLMSTDSNGVVHRETYYDLPMSRVMQNCGAGGDYAVRDDGVKVDKDGYVIIAAYLTRYPRCSLVETSLGQGKVYDTGGFVANHPDGFDLATDWSNYDGI